MEKEDNTCSEENPQDDTAVRNNSPHFLLVGHEGSQNRGCEALVRTTVSILREQYSQAYFTVASKNPENDYPLQDIHGLEIVPGICQLPSLYDESENLSSAKAIARRRHARRLIKAVLPHGMVVIANKHAKKVQRRRSFARPSSEHEFEQVRHLRNAMLSADLVISIGGDNLTEDYGPPTYYLELLEYAQHLKRRTMTWGVSIWPFKDKQLEGRIQQAFSSCDLVTVRDELTLNYLSALSLPTRLELVADGAFLMSPKESEQSRLRWTNEPSCIVGINCTTLLKSRSRKAILSLVDFMRNIIDEWECSLTLIPHDTGPAAREREISFEIREAVDRKGRVVLIPPGLDAQETKGLIGQCEAFIGMRFHPTIASLSQGVPTLGLSYSPKFAGLHQLVYGHTDYLIPYEDVSVEQLQAKFQQLKDNREEIRRQLLTRVAELQVLARRNGTLVRDLLG